MAEEAEEREDLANLLRKISAIVWEADGETLRPRFVNERALALLGHPIECWLEEADFWRRCLPDRDHERLIRTMHAVAADGSSRTREHRVRTVDGRTLWMHTEIHSLDEEHRPAHAIGGTMMDITERVKIEHELRAQQEESRAIFDSVPAMIFFKDKNNVQLRVNRLAAELKGMTVAEMEHRRTEDLYPEEAGRYHADDLEVINSGRPKLGIVEPHQIASGEKIWVRTDKLPFRDKDGNIAGVIGFAIDITEMVHAEEERLRLIAQEQTARAAAEEALSKLAEAQRALVHRERLAALGELAAAFANEVRNPLVAIFDSLEALHERVHHGNESAMLLGIIEEEARRLNRIVVDLLDFVRPLQPSFELASLPVVIDEAIAATERAAPSESVRVSRSHVSDLPQVVLDPQLMHLALVNVLSNAFEVMPDGGQIHVAAALERRSGMPYASISISDTGPGIPHELQTRVFEPFFTTRAAGTGLGLALVKRVIDSHRGALEVESEVGKGTTFRMFLPLRISSLPDAR